MTASLNKFSSKGSTQADLKTSDGSAAGTTDVTKKADIGFSLMRNAINSDGQVSGSDINDYLERAQDLNDEIESVGFAIETDDGDIVKVYVNAKEADAFEQELSKLLGLSGDFEEAVNQLAQKYDIVDVVWPQSTDDDEGDPDAELTIDNEDGIFSDTGDEEELPAGNSEVSDAEIIDIPAAETNSAETTDDEIIDIPAENEESAEITADGGEEEIIDIPPANKKQSDDADIDNEMEPVLNADGTQKLDKDGNPVMRKKKVTKPSDEEPITTEEGLAEGVRDELARHVSASVGRGQTGTYIIKKTISGDTHGLRSAPLKRNGAVAYFEKLADAQQEAERLTRHMNRAGATASYKYEPTLVEHKQSQQKENVMIGTNFLARIDERAKAQAFADQDSIKDGMNIPLEAGHLQLVTSLKRPLEKKIVALFAMAGIVGRLLRAEPDALERIRERADMLRKNKAAQLAFNDFYSALAIARGYSPTAGIPKHHIAEKHDPKRGSATQKKFEAVLVALGLPEGLVTVKGPGVLAPFIAAATLAIDQNGDLKAKLIQLALRLGVHGSDAPEDMADDEADAKKARTPKIDKKLEKPGFKAESVIGRQFLNRLDELNPVKSNDPFAKDVIELLRALGVTEEHLGYKPQLLKSSLESVGRSLKQRSLVDQRVEALTNMLRSGKKVQNQQMEEGQLTEAFNELEAITRADAHYYKLDEPSAGPAHMASYPGGNHEETVLTVGIDIQKEGMKTLRVGIDGPFDGELHTKYFADDEAGYKDALKYANMLRTVNLKQGGRPKGWRE